MKEATSRVCKWLGIHIYKCSTSMLGSTVKPKSQTRNPG